MLSLEVRCLVFPLVWQDEMVYAMVRCVPQREWECMVEKKMQDWHPAVQLTWAASGVQH